MDKVAGFLEVGRTDDSHEVVIIHPNLELDANSTARILFSTRYALYLANLLIEHATYAEAEAAGVLPNSKPQSRRNHEQRRSPLK